MDNNVKTLDDVLGNLDPNTSDDKGVDLKPTESVDVVLQKDTKSESSDVPKSDKPKGKPGPKPKPKDTPNTSDKPKQENIKAANASKPHPSPASEPNIKNEVIIDKPINLFKSPAAKSIISKCSGVYIRTGECVGDMIQVSKVVKGVGKVDGWIKQSDCI